MLLSRLPLRIATALDLHVLGLPPAFALSQDQTLKLDEILKLTGRALLAQSFHVLTRSTHCSFEQRCTFENVDRQKSLPTVVALNCFNPNCGPQGPRRPRFSFFRFTCQTARDPRIPTNRWPGWADKRRKPLVPPMTFGGMFTDPVRISEARCHAVKCGAARRWVGI